MLLGADQQIVISMISYNNLFLSWNHTRAQYFTFPSRLIRSVILSIRVNNWYKKNHKGHFSFKLNSAMVSVLLSLNFPLHLLSFPVHLTGFHFCFFHGFLAIFILLPSSHNNKKNHKGHLTSKLNSKTVPSYLLFYLFFIFYLP